jgi:uncharacterized alpha-E superfamily protein
MLSRNASSLYWLGRQLERADYLCRLVEATTRLAALPSHIGGASNAWQSAVNSAAVSESFKATGRPADEANVTHFLTLCPSNGTCIRACLEQARGNARAVRTALTIETWEAVNAAWLEMQRFGTAPLDAQTTNRLLDQVKAALQSFEGAAQRTQLREPTYWFMQLGTSVERADNTARLLDVKYHLLLPRSEPIGGSLDYFQWTTLLRTVSALTAYRWVYRGAVKPWLVADLLILNRAMPRSLAACYAAAAEQLDRLADVSGRRGPAHRAVAAGLEALTATDINHIFQGGLHEFLQSFIADNNRFGAAIAEQYLF